MKSISLFTFILLLVASLSCSSKKNVSRKHELTGKIINDIYLPPNCGYIAHATVIEFEIINSNLKNYTDKRIPIIVKCPEFYGDHFFEKNKTYSLNLIDTSQTNFKWTITNLNIEKKYNLNKRLWAVSIKKME